MLTSPSTPSLSFQDSALKLKEAEEAQSTLQAECEQYRAILAETVSCSPLPYVGLPLELILRGLLTAQVARRLMVGILHYDGGLLCGRLLC